MNDILVRKKMFDAVQELSHPLIFQRFRSLLMYFSMILNSMRTPLYVIASSSIIFVVV